MQPGGPSASLSLILAALPGSIKSVVWHRELIVLKSDLVQLKGEARNENRTAQHRDYKDTERN
jgi:hypothetical protein